MTINCFFVSDLHGNIDRYTKLFGLIVKEKPGAVFIGGDLLPSLLMPLTSQSVSHEDFINDFLAVEMKKIKSTLGRDYPRVFLILGNDDGRFYEPALLDTASMGIWEYVHDRHVQWQGYTVCGYSFIPPTPFRLKDWERYDVSRYVDPGCVAPEDGAYSVPVSESEKKFSTINEDLKQFSSHGNLKNWIFLFHSPPYQTKLDRAALDGKMIDYAPLDVHVGSIAIRRFIEGNKPLLTLHGHVHESCRLTGSWKDKIDNTHIFSAAHDGPELSLIRFNPADLEHASRELI